MMLLALQVASVNFRNVNYYYLTIKKTCLTPIKPAVFGINQEKYHF